jgi:hypothetical protein
MNENPIPDPLLRWNDLARENTENAMVSSMFEAMFKTVEPLEKFSTWLLVGTAAVASFFIANADKVIPFIKPSGFLACGAFLCLSCVFGLVSKIYAVRCTAQIEGGAMIRKTFFEHLTSYGQTEEEILESARARGITLQTGIRMERVLREFAAPFPIWVAWLAARQLRKHAGNVQVGYLPTILSLRGQGFAAAAQAVSFLGFLVAGFVSAAA